MIQSIKALGQLAKRIPGGPALGRALRNAFTSHERVFTRIYRENKWGGRESVSGPGSDLSQVRHIIHQLPRLCQGLAVASILDVPCGDCHWITLVNLEGVDYIGADIVRELVAENARKYVRYNVRFVCLNLIADPLPRADLVLCRDCLVHFCFRDVSKALRNICSSNSTYLLTTTFVSRKENRDIITGEWRPLNLEVPPFHFPKPLTLINEGCSEVRGIYSDKSLGLWRIEEIEQTLTKPPSQP